MASVRQVGQAIIDAALLAVVFVLAYLLRFDLDLPPQPVKYMFFQLPYVVALQYTLMATLGARRVVWQFVSLTDIKPLTQPLVAAALVLGIVRVTAPMLPLDHLPYLIVPFGVILIDLVLGVLAVMGIRIVRRLWAEQQDRNRVERPKKLQRVLLVGAGKAGMLVATEISRRPDLGLEVVGFVDDDRSKLGTQIGGHRVLSALESIGRVASDHEVDDVVITMTEAAPATIRKVVATCEELSISVKIIPGLYEIIGGQVSVSRLREVQIEDLLGRDAVKLDTERVSDFVRRKVVAVTGAGGSIGSELCRQVAGFGPRRLLLIERSENALFEIHRELMGAFPNISIEPCLADVTGKERLQTVLTKFGCDAIFHAAAHKHVPMMEWNPSEAIRNNVLGTKCIADLAAELGIGHFVLISTDKAINPTSVMGASKRVAELYVQAMGRAHTATKFLSVRFGNVLGSAGSVVPIFKQQIAAGGPVMVTHPDMVRYFMTIPEAAQLVLQAATLSKGGEVFILDMGEPVKIVELARDLIRLSGLKPDRDILIEFSGTRPGEKLFEELSTDEEQADKTMHDKIFVGHVKESNLTDLNRALGDLERSMTDSKPKRIYEELGKLIPEFSGMSVESERAPLIKLVNR